MDARSGHEKPMKTRVAQILTAFALLGWFASVAPAQPPQILAQPTNAVVLGGLTATFSVAVSGEGPFTYYWLFNGTNLPSDIIATEAGNGKAGHSGDGGPAVAASLNNPWGVTADAAGNLFIADQNNRVVRKVGANGVITTVAGNGAQGYSGDGGAATNATLNNPSGVAVDADGNLFIADDLNNRVRKVDLTGIITTVAGTGAFAFAGDGGFATNASLSNPSGVSVDGSGNLFIADFWNNRIRKVDRNGIITTVAGGGSSGLGDGGLATNAGLQSPTGVVMDSSGNLFIADPGDNRVRRVDTNGVITTVAGNGPNGFAGDSGPATNATLNVPRAVAVDIFGDILIADFNNNRIRKLDKNGIITTVAGNGSEGYSSDGGAATNATLHYPSGVAVDASGFLYIADSGNNRLRRVALAGYPTLDIENVSAANDGDYQVVVTSPSGSVTSAVATLTVVFPPSIVAQPASVAAPIGGVATLGVEATGTLPLAYCWYFNGTNLVQSGTNSTLSVARASFADAGDYTVVVTNLFASATSGVATLSVGYPPAITNEPASQTNAAGAAVTLSVGVSGTGPLSYQWQLNGANLSAIHTVAGNGQPGYSGDGGPATQARLNIPEALALDSLGNLFIADYENDRVRRVDPSGTITTVAGVGSPGYSGDGGPATEASLYAPSGVAVDAAGNLYIADQDNNRVRKVDSAGVITTVAGNGSPAYSGDGGPAIRGSLFDPEGLAVDASGNLLVADQLNCRIRKVDALGTITTVAGDGPSLAGGYSGDGGPATMAHLNLPLGVAADLHGNFFIADTFNDVVRKVDTNGIITTVAGNGRKGYSGDGGFAIQASLDGPSGVAVDLSGDLLIADSVNNVVRKVDDNGMIATVAGNGSPGYLGDGGGAANAELSYPRSFAVARDGNVFIADSDNNVIRKALLAGPNLVLHNASGANDGSYNVVVSSPYGSVTSSAAILTVLLPPSITTQPANAAVTAGDTAELTVAATGTAPLAYNWYFNGATLVQGGTNSTLSFPNALVADAGEYTVVVTNLYGSATSSVAGLSVVAIPVVAQPASLAVAAGRPATLSVEALGAPPLFYSWYFNGTNLVQDGTNFTLSIPAATLADAGEYAVVITNQYGSATSAVATLVVGYLPSITSQSGSPSVVAGSNATLAVTVSGGGPYTYHWLFNGTNDLDNRITTVAGNGYQGYFGDGGAATKASLNYPSSVAVDITGNLYITDRNNNVVRKVETNGTITTVAGNFLSGGGYSGDGGAATNANLQNPAGVAVDPAGNLFIADEGNQVIRKVDTNGIITTVAGNYSSGSGYSGDGGPATNASMQNPEGVAADASGNLFIADSGNSVIRKVDTNGIITTVAGDGFGGGYSGDGGAATDASLSYPAGLALDGVGDLFIADEDNNVIRKVDTNGIITTVAGNNAYGGLYFGDGDLATNASLNRPSGVAVDVSGNLFVADWLNFVVREVGTNGIITTVAGNGTAGYTGDGGPATSAELDITLSCGRWCGFYNNPLGVAVDAAGNLIIADSDNERVREVVFPGPTLILENVERANAGSYSVVVSSPYGSITSVVATLEVFFPPSVVGQRGTQAVAVGNSATLGVDATGTPPLSFFWYRNGTNLVAVSTNSTFSLANAVFSDAGIYTVVVTNLFGSASSEVAAISVGYPPVITNEPAGQTAMAGSNVTLAVAASGGGPYTYQWRVNGANLPSDVINTVAGGWFADGVAATNASIVNPDAVAVDTSGDLLIADSVNQRVRKVDTNGIISTVAGDGMPGFSGDGGPATKAKLNGPSAVVSDASGNLFIADAYNDRIRKVDANGIITTVAGNGSFGDSGDGGAATMASLNFPRGLSVDASGNLFIADSGNNRVRMVDTNGIISTVAGSGVSGYSGDGAVATKAKLNYPLGLALDALGEIFISDSGNNRVRKVGANGIITTVAGDGNQGYSGDGGGATGASLNYPASVAVDISGNLFIADLANERVRKVGVKGVIITVAGNGFQGYSGDGGPANRASLFFPQGVAADASGNLFIADQDNYRVRKVGANGIITTAAGNGSPGYFGDGGPATMATLEDTGVGAGLSGEFFIADQFNNRIRKVGVGGVITTVAGDGASGYSGDGGPAQEAGLSGPSGMAADAVGNLYIADAGNNVVRKVDANGIITTVAGNNSIGSGYSGDGGWATNAGMYYPNAVALDPAGNLFIADGGNNRVRKVDVNGIITTVAGNGNGGYSGDGGPGAEASIGNPAGVAADAFGNVFIVDNNNSVVRKVDVNGLITTVAGNGSAGYSGDGGPATGAKLASPNGVALDAAGNLFIADSGNSVIRKVDVNAIITTVAGNVTSAYSGDGGPATTASLAFPQGVAVDASTGNLLIADSGNGRVREVYFSGLPTLILGDVSSANGGDYQVVVTSPFGSVTSAVAAVTTLAPPAILEQPANTAAAVGTTATFSVDAVGPQPLFYSWYFDQTNLVASGTNSSLLLPGASFDNAGDYTAVVTNLFGSATSAVATLAVGYPPAITNGPPSQTAFDGGRLTLAVDAGGTGPFSYQWQRNGVDMPQSIITTIAGGWVGDGGAATTAILGGPSGVAEDASGNLFIADPGNSRVRRVDANGTISTVAGDGSAGYSGDGGSATNASLSGPYGVAVDAAGNLFIAESGNNRVRRVDASGIITTVAGNGTAGFSGDGGPGTNASLNGPISVALDAAGNLFIADGGNNVVRKVDANGTMTTAAGNISFGGGYSGDGGPARAAGLNFPSGVAVDAAGNLLIADEQNYVIRKVDAHGIITTVAGNGNYGFAGDGGQATAASLGAPAGVAVDSSGNLLIADAGNSVIRRVDNNGIITTVAGGHSAGYFGDGGLATMARLDNPLAVAADAAGDLFIADSGNQVIRMVNSNGVITTLAGDNAFRGAFSGDGRPAANASLNSPSSATMDANGNLYIVDSNNQAIRKVDANGVITTVAGNGTNGYFGDGGVAKAAQFSYPSRVAVDFSGNVYIVDSGNERVRKVDANGLITTVAGNGSYGYSGDGGAATNAMLNYPYGVAVDASGNIYISDINNERVRRVGANGVISTVAGNGSQGYMGDGGFATQAKLNIPRGVAIDAIGNLFIADSGNNLIRKIATNGIITTVAGGGGNGYSGDGGPAIMASLNNPYDVAVDVDGNLYIADLGNEVIRKVDPTGIITTVAGGGAAGLGDGGDATNAILAGPASVAVDVHGNLLIADTGNNRIREVDIGGLPALTLGDLSPANDGLYQVIVTSPYGSVTSAVATVTVSAPPVILMNPPIVAGNSLLLGFSLAQGSSPSFTLLQAANVTGPWTTNSGAVLATNLQSGGYKFSIPAPGSTQFYRVRAP
jgi:sugar lactone lactonase YvrE